MDTYGRPARELSDEELEQQGTHAHATRNWVFLHGTAEQFQHHTERMLELEQEYLRRYPKRTWQGVRPGDGGEEIDPETKLRTALRSIARQVEALLEEHPGSPDAAGVGPAPSAAAALLQRIAAMPDGRMHKLEAHQAAREVGLERAAVAQLYTGQPQLLATEHEYRVITPAGREWLAGQGGGADGGGTLHSSNG
jgi:hypothetical protein